MRPEANDCGQPRETQAECKAPPSLSSYQLEEIREIMVLCGSAAACLSAPDGEEDKLENLN